jgi:antitoxin CptB
MDAQRKKLIFRSDHRGIKEMDLILGTFAREFVPTATQDEIDAYEELLNESDPDLYNWISMREDVPADNDNIILPQLIGYQIPK